MIEISFQPSFTRWCPTTVYEKLLILLQNKYSDKISYVKKSYDNESNSITGPHHCILKNNKGNYKVCSYWDNPICLTYDAFGWKPEKCLGMYSSVGAAIIPQLTPSSYCCYTQDIEDFALSHKMNFDQKQTNTELIFRGYLYGDRYNLNNYLKDNPESCIHIHKNTLDRLDYIQEINNKKICLSLNGQAEICNRDMEILAVGSVLFRPKLQSTKFHKEFIDNYHYISFDFSPDPVTQTQIIQERFHTVAKDIDFLSFVAYNGHRWFLENGTTQANAETLFSIINIEELFC